MHRVVTGALFLFIWGLMIAPASAAAPGPRVRYLFDRATDEPLRDQSGHGYNGTDVFAQGDGAWIETTAGAAVRFSAQNDRIEVPYAAFPGGQGRIKLRVRLDRLDQPRILFRLYTVDGDGLMLSVKAGRLQWQYYDRSAKKWLTAQCSATVVGDGKWHELMASWNVSKALILQVDGRTQASRPLNLKAGFPRQGSMVLGNEYAGGRPMLGEMAEFVLWSQPLDDSAAGNPAPVQPLRFTSDQTVTLANRHLGFLFSRKYAVPVGSIRPAHPELPVLADSYLPDELTLWQITFATDFGRGQSITLDNRDPAATRQVDIVKTDTGQEARLAWTGLKLPGVDAGVEVLVTVDLPDDSAMSQWRIQVRAPDSKWGVNEIHFPLITFAPPAKDPSAVRLVLPYRWGLAVPDPFYIGMAKRGGEYRRQAVYPSNMPMQFFAICGQSGASTYYATLDPAGFVKDYTFVALPARQRMRLLTTHYPEQRDRSSYTMPYACVLGVFDGDWYDATQIYRKWALQQPWASEGPLYRRSDVPDWLKRADLVVKNSTGEPGRTVQSNVQGLGQLLKHFKGPILSCWYGWQNFDDQAGNTVIPPKYLPTFEAGSGRPAEPRPGIGSALAELLHGGGYATAYINSKVYDQGKTPDRDALVMSRAAIVDQQGNHPLYNADILPAWLMCRASPLWQQRMAELGRQAMGYGFKGVYFDSFGRGESWCYAADHGHPIAGGKVGLNGQHQEARRLRQAIRAIDPDAVLVSEASTEYFIDVIDTKLLHYDVLANGAPLWMAVYHDYQLFYGRSYGQGRDLTDQSFRQRLGTLFVHGGQLGRFFSFGAGDDQGRIYPFTGDAKAHLAFLQQLVHLKREQRAFLTFGAMLRPAKIEPTPELLATTVANHRVPVPTILTSSWRDPEGRAAIVIVNTCDEVRKIELMFDTVEYGLAAGRPIRVTRCTAEGAKPAGRLVAGPVRLSEQLSPAQAVVLVLSAEPE